MATDDGCTHLHTRNSPTGVYWFHMGQLTCSAMGANDWVTITDDGCTHLHTRYSPTGGVLISNGTAYLFCNGTKWLSNNNSWWLHPSPHKVLSHRGCTDFKWEQLTCSVMGANDWVTITDDGCTHLHTGNSSPATCWVSTRTRDSLAFKNCTARFHSFCFLRLWAKMIKAFEKKSW